jgi:peptide deformylase
MAVREIVMFGDPILRQKAKRIHRFDPALPRLVADMFATMHAARGIGLAAPQIGLSIRLLVIELDDAATGRRHKIALANPEIVEARGEQVGGDGCLSIPGYYGVNVRRAAAVVVRGQNLRGKPVRLTAEGLLAWALQHEIDHLDGILYIDRLDRPEDLRPVHLPDAAEIAVGIEDEIEDSVTTN